MRRPVAILTAVMVVIAFAVVVTVVLLRRGSTLTAPAAPTPSSCATVSPTAPLGSNDNPAVQGASPTIPAAAEPVVPSASASEGLRPVAEWDALFQRQWQSEQATAEQLSHSRDSWDHYNLSYSVDELTADYLATGRLTDIDEGLSLIENVVATAVPSNELPRSQYHDSYLGWASEQQGGQEVPLYESYFWRYATGLLRVVGKTPSLLDDPAIQPRYQRLLSFAEHDVFDKWYSRGADQNIYRDRTHLAAHWALIALNLSEITTDSAARSQYLQVVHAIDNGLPQGGSLKGQMVADPKHDGAYFWSDVWLSCAHPGQDVAHGNGVIAYVVEAHDQGVGWTDADMTAFVRTLTNVVWPQAGPGAEYVDGSGTGTGWFSDGFVKLGRYDAALQRRLETHQPANGQFYANGALNAAILLCPARGSAAPAGSTDVAPVCTGSSPPP